MAKTTQSTPLFSSNELAGAEKWGLNPYSYAQMRPMLNLVDEFKTASTDANKANEARYQQGLSNWDKIDQLYSNYKPQAQGEDFYAYGKAQRGRIGEAQRTSTAQGMQSLAGSGMLNSTMTNAVQNRAAKTAADQHMELDDAVNSYRVSQRDKAYNQNLAINEQALGNKVNALQGRNEWIYNKNDEGPNPDFFAQMMQTYAKDPARFIGMTEAQTAMFRNLFSSKG